MRKSLIAVLMVVAVGVCAQDSGRMERSGLENLARVEEGVYRGARPDLDEDGMKSLEELNVGKIVDLQGGDLSSPDKAGWPGWRELIATLEPGETPDAIAAEKSAAERVGIDFVNVPMSSVDPVTSDEAAGIDRVLRMLHASDGGRPIYVHCEAGKDRTGLVIALYRMRYDHWSQDQAAREMADMGHTGAMAGLFTKDMDLDRVLARYPELARP